MSSAVGFLPIHLRFDMADTVSFRDIRVQFVAVWMIQSAFFALACYILGMIQSAFLKFTRV